MKRRVRSFSPSSHICHKWRLPTGFVWQTWLACARSKMCLNLSLLITTPIPFFISHARRSHTCHTAESTGSTAEKVLTAFAEGAP
jgi:hypothetical protein